jgi:sortase A
LVLFLAGAASLSYYVYTLADQYVYQAYENWAFDQGISGHRGVTFADYLREATPLRWVFAGESEKGKLATQAQPAVPARQAVQSAPATGTVLGRVEVGRLHLSAIVRQGVDARTLSVAVGHVESTSMPDQQGNFVIAAHRDTLFRGLKDIKAGDIASFQSEDGTTYTYRLLSTKIVEPSDVSVLQPDGGGLLPGFAADKHLLTMITCYPFYYVGSAPKRFIVEGELISENSTQAESARPGDNSVNRTMPPARMSEKQG